MKKVKMYSVVWAFMFCSFALYAQKSVQEYVDKNGKDKIKKAVVVEQKPVTASGFSDGHGRNPVLTSKDQLPKNVGLITFYVYDRGTTTVKEAGNMVVTTSTWVSPEGGNMLANSVHERSVATLKQTLQQQGATLLFPKEYLDTQEKRNFYYDGFTPRVSKLGKFLGNIEMKSVDIAVAADYYRGFDIASAWDHLRCVSYGSELANKLGVNGVLSIAIEIESSSKTINILGAKMALHGPNPIAKEDKKYIAQDMGNGYYEGQIYASSYFYFPKPIEVGEFDKKKIEGLKKKATTLDGINFDGIDVVLQSMLESMYESMNESIDKAAAKYKKN